MHTITVTLSGEAQRAALLAGQDAASTQSYEVTEPGDIPALLALPGTRVGSDGTAHCAVGDMWYEKWDCEREEGEPIGAPQENGYGRVSGALAVRPANASEAIAAAARVYEEFEAAVVQARREHAQRRREMEQERESKLREQTAAAQEWGQRMLSERVDAQTGVLVGVPATVWCGAYTPREGREALQQVCPEAYAEAMAESGRIVAAREAAQREAREKAEAGERARRAELNAVEISITRGDARDWGAPWGATVTAGRGRKDEYDFAAGEYDLSREVLTIKCAPGDVIAWGQKNYRKPKRTIHERRKVGEDWSLIVR